MTVDRARHVWLLDRPAHQTSEGSLSQSHWQRGQGRANRTRHREQVRTAGFAVSLDHDHPDRPRAAFYHSVADRVSIAHRTSWTHEVSGVDRSVSARALDGASSGAGLDEPFLTRWGRRALTIPAFLLAPVVAIAALPLAILVTLALDVGSGRRLPRTRFAVGIVFLLLCESAGIVGSFLTWALSGAWFGKGSPLAHRLDRGLQHLWAGALLQGGRRILGLGLRVVEREGLRDAGPVLVLARHASLVDSLLPLVLLGHFRLRYVLKR